MFQTRSGERRIVPRSSSQLFTLLSITTRPFRVLQLMMTSAIGLILPANHAHAANVRISTPLFASIITSELTLLPHTLHSISCSLYVYFALYEPH